MYNQILYFVVALLIFTIQQPGTQAVRTASQTVFLGLGVFFIYAFICRVAIRQLKSAAESGLPTASLAIRYHRLQTRLSILALGALAVYVYVLNIKFYLEVIPGFRQSLTLSGIVGIGLYLVHLTVTWLWSHPLYQKIHRSNITRPTFLKGQVAFVSAILVPWLLISLASDLLQTLKTPAFLSTTLGQFLLLGIILTTFILFAPWLVVRLWGCQTIPANPTRTELERFIHHWHFRVGDFKLWPLFGGEMLTAGVVGILPRLRYILITKGLLGLLDTEELKAVVAHEMGHVRRLHLFFYLLFFLSYAILAYSLNDLFLAFLLRNETFLKWAVSSDTYYLTLFSVVYSLPVLLFLVVYFRYFFGFFLRNSERQADLYALQLIGHPFTLISSLEKIALFSGQIQDLPSWHHFSIRKRIEFLMESHRNRKVAQNHNLKLYGAALVFLAGVTGLSIIGFSFQNSQTVNRWRTETQLHLVERELEREPDNPKLYSVYGGLLLENGRYSEAESVLQKALTMTPQDPTAMNNLAWLYATSPPPFFNPRAALELALEAADMDPEPHILDTLAEAYFVNGFFEEALETIREALLLHPDNREYLLRQENKFEQAFRNQDRSESGGDDPI